MRMSFKRFCLTLGCAAAGDSQAAPISIEKALAIAPADIRKIKVEQTWVGGQRVY
jgi:hypothetical protein